MSIPVNTQAAALYPPGSDVALEMGCTCFKNDMPNHFGLRFGWPVDSQGMPIRVISPGCPLHTMSEVRDD